MAWGTDGMIKQALTDLGADKVGVMRTPTYGTGKMADTGNATQSISFFITKWSKYPQQAADFLAWLHTADGLTHGTSIPALSRQIRVSTEGVVTDPVLKQMVAVGNNRSAGLAGELPARSD